MIDEEPTPDRMKAIVDGLRKPKLPAEVLEAIRHVERLIDENPDSIANRLKAWKEHDFT